jgi:hypothetical protein
LWCFVAKARLKKNPQRAWFTAKPIHCHLVLGSPFVEDLSSRFPSARLKIEVKIPALNASQQGLADITVEHLFEQLRPFGRIHEISLSNYVKDQPRQAVVQFLRMFSAVGARNCLHRFRFPVLPPPPPAAVSQASLALTPTATTGPTDVVIFLTYDSMLKTSVITDFFVRHPRIVIPLLGFLFAAFTYLIFDPCNYFQPHGIKHPPMLLLLGFMLFHCCVCVFFCVCIRCVFSADIQYCESHHPSFQFICVTSSIYRLLEYVYQLGFEASCQNKKYVEFIVL